MIDRRVDLAIGFVVIAFAIVVLVFSGHIRPTGPVVDPIGPRGFPYFIGTMLLLSGAANVYGQLRRWEQGGPTMVETDGEPDEPGVPASSLQALAVIAASFAYVLAMTRVGYLIATPVYVAAALWVMRLRSWRTLILTAAIYSIVTFLIFAVAMRVNLPLGPLGGLLRGTGFVR